MEIQSTKVMDRTFNTSIQKRVVESWDEIAFQDYGKPKTYSYGTVAEEIKRLHCLFESLGLEKGDKVMSISANGSEWSIVFLAVATYGAVIVPVLPDFMPEDILNIVDHSDAKLAFFSQAQFERFAELQDRFQLDVLELESKQVLHKQSANLQENLDAWQSKFEAKYPEPITPSSFELPNVEPDAILEISYTSGTSGGSKGVMLSHHSIFMNAAYCLDIQYPIGRGDRCLAFLPMAHSFGCAFDFLMPFLAGCHNTFLTKLPTPQVLLKALDEVRPVHLLSVPLVIEKIYQNKLKPTLQKPLLKVLTSIPGLRQLIFGSIRKKLLKTFGGNLYQVILGGAPLNPEVEAFFQKIKFPFTVGYGMTECGPLISYASWEDFKSHACGKVIRAMEARIDSADAEKISGEIQVRGEHVMKGYYKNQEATDQMFTEDGWLKTGDMGVMDRDGFLYINGRCKSMLLGSSGQNIYPEEIESLFVTSDYIVECLAIQRAGSSNITLLVFPNYELEADKTKMAEQLEKIRKKLNHKLASYMKVINLELQDEEFIKTPKKSIKRYLYTD